jgi:hypothetical protein
MNIERGLRRLLVLVTAVLVLVMAGWSVLLSRPPASCAYQVVLADGTSGRITAPQLATIEQVQIEARRLYPDKNPLVLPHLTGDLKKDLMLVPSPPDAPADPIAESCAANERAIGRLARYAWDVTTGVAVALPIVAVLWVAFFALRWVALGFLQT